MSFLFSKTRFMLVAFCACCVVASLGLSPAFGKKIKRYAIKSAEVHYKVQGSGNIMGTQTTSSGKKSLYFRDYGNQVMEEETVRESMSGLAGNKQETKHTMTKKDQSKIYEVNFKRKQISVIEDPSVALYGGDMGKDPEKMLKGLGGQKIGSDKVLGHTCTIWSIMGSKQCLYKNQVPLWIEINIMGIQTKETAVSAKFNHRISDKHFQLPAYPVQKGFGGPAQGRPGQEENPMAALMQAFGQEGQQQGNPNDPGQQLMAAFGQGPQMNNQLQKVKRDTPIMLKLLKKCRSCLQKADSQNQAQRCGQRMEQEMQRQGIRQEHEKKEKTLSWSAQDKKKTLAELDQTISKLEKSMPCIKRAKTFMDFINCQEMDE